MNLTQISLAPISHVIVHPDELKLLLELSANHYDGHCQKASSVGGFLYGMKNRAADGSADPHPLSWDELDTISKILEMGSYLSFDRAKFAESMRSELRGIMKTIRDDRPDPITYTGTEAVTSKKLLPVPDWVVEIEAIELSPQELEGIAEYSCSLPDSYKRPLSQGGRPWKRDLNFFGKFAPPGEKIWIYCEYVTDPDPKMLGILSKRVVLTSSTSH